MKSTIRIFSWIFLIAVSIVASFWLRPIVDLTWQEPLKKNASEIEQAAKPILSFLGMSDQVLDKDLLIDYSITSDLVKSYSDSLKIGVNEGLIKKVVDDGNSIVRWSASLLEVKPIQRLDAFNSSSFYQKSGIARLEFSSTAKVISVRTKENAEIGLIQGSSIEEVGNRILEKFGYSIKDYILLQNVAVDEINNSKQFAKAQDSTNNEHTNNVELVWNNASPTKGNPAVLRMSLVPSLAEDTTETGTTVINSGFKLKAFDSQMKVSGTNEATDNQGVLTTLVFVGCAFFLLVMVFISALIPIIKGRVDWRKALFVFLMVALAVVFWRGQYVWRLGSTTLSFLDILLSFINDYFISALIALYSSMAFIGWNNLARDFNHPEFRLFNEYWFLRFKFKETGLAIIQGIGLGFVYLLFTFFVLKLANIYMYNYEGLNLNVSEPESFFPPLTITASAWSISLIAALGQVGVVTDLLHKWVKKVWAAVGISVLLNAVIGVFFIRMFATNADLEIDFLLFLPIAFFLVISYKKLGFVTLSFSLFTYTVLVNLLPFIQPGVGIGPLSTAVILLSLLASLFAIAVYWYKNAPSVEEETELLPEYELRFQTQERVVREIEVARQTQMQLMPTHPPHIEGVDLYGFFMPSFEVGGDYYYYQKLPNDGEEQLAFTVLDVSGKAMRAAIQAVFTSGLIMSRMNTDTPDEILDAIAPNVHTHTDAKTFITCIVGRYDAKLRSLNFANAGHCMPLLKRGDTADFLETSAPKFPLGMLKEVDYKARTVQLEIGDVLLLYSDGFPEAENRKRDRIGFDGVKEMMTKMDTAELTSREIGERIKKRIIAHSGQQLADDTTVIVMKIVG